jgi:hypothetical protein
MNLFDDFTPSRSGINVNICNEQFNDRVSHYRKSISYSHIESFISILLCLFFDDVYLFFFIEIIDDHHD